MKNKKIIDNCWCYRFANTFKSATVNKRNCILTIVLCTVLLSVFLCGHSYAGVWRDTFHDAELKGWQRTAEHNPWNARWEAVEGILFSQIQRVRNTAECEKNAADFLHYNAHQFNLDRLTLIGKEITYKQEGPRGMGELCLFLGKRRIAPHFVVEGYIVSPEETSKVTFSEKDDYSRGKTKAWYGDKFPFTTNHLKVVFDSGRFRVFTDEVLLTEFIDNRFSQINVVGLLITCHFGAEWFGSRISSFSISGAGIPDHNLAVQLQGTQLTTTWGQLKRFE